MADAVTLTHNHYEPDGPETRPPLLVAHGLFGSARNWHTLAGGLAEGRRVIAVDMRNHGQSPHDEDMSYAAMAADLARVMAEEGAEDLLGHSMGGKAAMTLALTEPSLVRRLVVADIAPVGYSHSHLPHIEAMQALDLSAISRRGEADKALAEAIPDRALRGFLLQSLAIENGAARWKLNLGALAEGMAGLIGFPDLDGGYDGPALFLHGSASDYVAAEHHGTIRRLFPKAEIDALEGAGHWLHAEQPQAFVAAVNGWLGRDAAGSRGA